MDNFTKNDKRKAKIIANFARIDKDKGALAEELRPQGNSPQQNTGHLQLLRENHGLNFAGGLCLPMFGLFSKRQFTFGNELIVHSGKGKGALAEKLRPLGNCPRQDTGHSPVFCCGQFHKE